MLEYWKDGKAVKCDGIYGEGRIGQVVIHANVHFGKNPDLKRFPLANFPQPCAFVIVEKVSGRDGYYVVRDPDGNRITLKDPGYGASEGWLYDANEWLAWQEGHTKEKLRRKGKKIQLVEGQRDLLKSILVSQGFRVISESQAKKLGIT